MRARWFSLCNAPLARRYWRAFLLARTKRSLLGYADGEAKIPQDPEPGYPRRRTSVDASNFIAPARYADERYTQRGRVALRDQARWLSAHDAF